MTHRFTVALAALTLSTSLGTGAALARVRVGADVASTLPLGATEKIADPAFTGRAKIQWLSPNERLIIGIVGGQVRQPHRLPSEPTLTSNIVGGEVGWIFGPKDWGTRPYLSMQAGFAQHTLNNEAEFNRGPDAKESSSGMFIIPEAGLFVQLTKNFGLRFDFRYEYLRAFDEMAIDTYRTYEAHTMGLGAGIILTF